MSPAVSVVIVSWNSREDLLTCLEALPQALGAVPYEVIVVDNASADGSPQALRSRGDLRLVELDTNTGFTHGANRGAALAAGRHLLFLNPDLLAPPGTLARLVQALDEHPEAWAATPWFRFPDGQVQRFWLRILGGCGLLLCHTRWGRRLDRLTGERAARRRRYDDLPDPPPVMPIEGVGAACLLVRRAEFEAAGGFDERYFNFFQDGDLERRMARRQRVLLGVGTVEVRHKAGSTLRLVPRPELEGQFLHALRQFVATGPRRTRLLVEAGVRLDLLLPGAGRQARRRRALRPVEGPV